MIGGGAFGGIGRGNTITLSDILGNDAFKVKDADGATLFQVKSDGNVQIRQGPIGKVPAGTN